MQLYVLIRVGDILYYSLYIFETRHDVLYEIFFESNEFFFEPNFASCIKRQRNLKIAINEDIFYTRHYPRLVDMILPNPRVKHQGCYHMCKCFASGR